jgi:hypothetical protein
MKKLILGPMTAAIIAFLPCAAFASSSLIKLKAALHKCREAEKLLQQIPPRFQSKIKAQMFLHQAIEQLRLSVEAADHWHNPIHFIPAKHKSRHKKPKPTKRKEQEVRIIE